MDVEREAPALEDTRDAKSPRSDADIEILNFTPHAAHYHAEDGTVTEWPSVGELRAIPKTEPKRGSVTLGNQTFVTYTDEGHTLDEESSAKLRELRGKAVIVSFIMANAIRDQPERFGVHVLVPNTESWNKQDVRNEKKQICGCRSFLNYGLL